MGGGYRWGTLIKVLEINKYISSINEEVYQYVGIASDEIHRREENIYKLYPLIAWNMKEKDCLEYCYSKGFNWCENGIELYDILDRVSCWCCKNKNLKELKNIKKFLPEYWDKLKEYQSKMMDYPFKPNATIFDLEERFDIEDFIFNSIDDVKKFISKYNNFKYFNKDKLKEIYKIVGNNFSNKWTKEDIISKIREVAN